MNAKSVPVDDSRKSMLLYHDRQLLGKRKKTSFKNVGFKQFNYIVNL